MKKTLPLAGLVVTAMILWPATSHAQETAQQIRGLHSVLTDLFDKMMPRCSMLMDYARILASFAATFYIGHRVWKSIAAAEPIDFYPLLRPFCLGLCIMMFPTVINIIGTILKPLETGTQNMVDTSNAAIKKLLAKREAERIASDPYIYFGSNDGEGNREEWLKYAHPDDAKLGENWLEAIGNDMEFAWDKAYYNFKNTFKNFISWLLQLFYEAAALCVNTIRTFNLIICALLGPFVFALACFDGFTHSLTVWLARYINFYLWLPIANILSAVLGMIQEGMIELDIQQIANYGDSFFSSADWGYLIFMIIGIVSYFTIPNLAAMVINPGVGSALSSKVGGMAGSAVRTATHTTGAVFGAAVGAIPIIGAPIGMAADAFGDLNTRMTGGHSGYAGNSGYFRDKLQG